ncbi:hypothetical protein HUU05_11560 [candidate division KSB1 bacterium]|nr:hypothetical protein [candidate division KSB1 bacterium]
MQKHKNNFAAIEPNRAASASKKMPAGKNRLAELPKRTVSGLWPLLIFLGLLLAVVLMHWFRTSN